MSSARIIPALKNKFVPKRRVQQAEAGGASHLGGFNLAVNSQTINIGSKLSSTNILGEISFDNLLGSQINRTSTYNLSSDTRTQLLGNKIAAGSFLFLESTEVIVVGKRSILGNMNSTNTINMNVLGGLNKYGNLSQEITTYSALASRISRHGLLNNDINTSMTMNSDTPGLEYGNTDLGAVFNILMTAQVSRLSALQQTATTNYSTAAANNSRGNLLITSPSNFSSGGFKTALGRALSATEFNQSVLGGLTLVSSINAAISTSQNFVPLRNVNGILNFDTSVNYTGFGQVLSYGVVTIDQRSYLEMVVLVESEEQPAQAFKLVYFDLSLLDAYTSSVLLPYDLSVSIR